LIALKIHDFVGDYLISVNKLKVAHCLTGQYKTALQISMETGIPHRATVRLLTFLDVDVSYKYITDGQRRTRKIYLYRQQQQDILKMNWSLTNELARSNST